MELRYVFSAPAMLRLNKSKWEDANPVEAQKVIDMTRAGLERLRADVKTMIPGVGFGLDLLFNAYTEKDMGQRIAAYDNFGFEKLYADSGGLQIVTLGKDVDDNLKGGIYKTQSCADFAMCFDEIPCGAKNSEDTTKSSRSNTDDKLYWPARAKECAQKTAHNIREQIEALDKQGTDTVVHYIIQGNRVEDMVEWFREGTKILTPDNWKRVGGLALADTCMGNGPLESVDMLTAYHQIREEFGVEMVKNHIHLLGLGSVNRLMPVMNLAKSGFLPDDLTISFDSTTFSMSYFMGRFLKSNGKKVSDGAHNYRKMFHEVWQYFGDIYRQHVPGVDEAAFIDHVVAQIRSLADAINSSNNDPFNPIVRSNITLTDCWQVLGFIKNLKDEMDKDDNQPISQLRTVKTMEDMVRWKRDHGHKIKTKRIARWTGVTLDALWEDKATAAPAAIVPWVPPVDAPYKDDFDE